MLCNCTFAFWTSCIQWSLGTRDLFFFLWVVKFELSYNFTIFILSKFNFFSTKHPEVLKNFILAHAQSWLHPYSPKVVKSLPIPSVTTIGDFISIVFLFYRSWLVSSWCSCTLALAMRWSFWRTQPTPRNQPTRSPTSTKCYRSNRRRTHEPTHTRCPEVNSHHHPLRPTSSRCCHPPRATMDLSCR